MVFGRRIFRLRFPVWALDFWARFFGFWARFFRASDFSARFFGLGLLNFGFWNTVFCLQGYWMGFWDTVLGIGIWLFAILVDADMHFIT